MDMWQLLHLCLMSAVWKIKTLHLCIVARANKGPFLFVIKSREYVPSRQDANFAATTCSSRSMCVLVSRETVRKVERLHLWDVARANKAPFSFGIEPRVPFLDKAFLQTSMSIDPQDKMVCVLPVTWYMLHAFAANVHERRTSR